MGSQLENAMETLIKVFHTYSSKEGDKYKLSKTELNSLLQGELSVFLAVSFERSYVFQLRLISSRNDSERLLVLSCHSRRVKIRWWWIK